MPTEAVHRHTVQGGQWGKKNYIWLANEPFTLMTPDSESHLGTNLAWKVRNLHANEHRVEKM